MDPEVGQQRPGSVQKGRPRSRKGQAMAERCISRLVPSYDQYDLKQEQGKKAKGIKQEDLHESVFRPLKMGPNKVDKITHHGTFSISGIQAATINKANISTMLNFLAMPSPPHHTLTTAQWLQCNSQRPFRLLVAYPACRNSGIWLLL